MAKILVIDDDPDILSFITHGLAGRHDVTVALNGEEGIAACRATHFDIVLTDIFMPYRDGLDVIREVTQSFKHIKLIAISGHQTTSKADFLKAAEALGSAASLKKPFTIEDLNATIDVVLKADT